MLTDYQLKAYELELLELKNKCMALDLKNKGSLISKSDVSLLQKYAKRMKQIQKILKKARKLALKKECDL